MKRAVGIVAGLIALVVLPVALFAHAVVFPRASAPGAYERYVLRVPNEKNVATTRVELTVPAGVRVTAFSDVAGWALDVKTDSAGAIVGAVWTGTLPPKRFIEFPFMAANPKTDSTIVWPAYQTYADGQRIEWTGAAGSKTPASVTTLAAAATAPAAGGDRWVAWAALVIAIIGLGLAIRKPAPPAAA